MRVAILPSVLLCSCFLLLQCPRVGDASGLLGFGLRFLTRKVYRIDAALRKRKEDVVGKRERA